MAVLLSDLIADAQERADMAGSASEFTTFWAKWCDDGNTELHRKVCSFFKATYFRTTPFSLPANAVSGTTYQYQLPSNIKRVKGLDLNPGTPRRQTVNPMDFASRNDSAGGIGLIIPLNIVRDRKYTVLGSSLLQIEPQENAAGNYALYWVPKPTPIVNPSDPMDPELAEWRAYPAFYAAKQAARKERDFELVASIQADLDIIISDMAEAVEVDEGGPSAIIDVDEFGVGRGGAGYY